MAGSPLGTADFERIGKMLKTALEPSHSRLDRMEGRMDVIVEKLDEKMASLEKRLRDLENAAYRSALVSEGVLKFTGWIVAGGIAFAYWLMRGQG